MSLNPSKGNMYEFVTHTWNTIKGECPHGCHYCYMKRWGQQKPVHLDEKELKTDSGSGNFIFVGSSCDMFAKNIPEDWILKTLSHCSDHENSYLFQSKNPIRFFDLRSYLPEKSIICTTIETNRKYIEMGCTPSPENRAFLMSEIDGLDKYVTIEPIMDFDMAPLVDLMWMCKPVQVNIGADTGNNHLPEPTKSKVIELINELNQFTRVVLKHNLNRILK